MPPNTKSVSRILLHIDDNLDDRLLLQAAIASSDAPFDFHGADGLETAVAYFAFLPRVNCAPGQPRPALVLLDYDLGAQCGTDFLYWLRVQHRNTAIPVIMYSGSASAASVAECYELGANYFLRKPMSFNRTMAVIRTLRACFSYPTPRFEFLARLHESEPDPRMSVPALA